MEVLTTGNSYWHTRGCYKYITNALFAEYKLRTLRETDPFGFYLSGSYPVKLEFNDEYPSKPPLVKLPAGFFHPNIYPSGKVCLSILNEDKAWKPSITVKQILVGVQELLDNPNNGDAANSQAYAMFKNKVEYAKVRV